LISIRTSKPSGNSRPRAIKSPAISVTHSLFTMKPNRRLPSAPRSSIAADYRVATTLPCRTQSSRRVSSLRSARLNCSEIAEKTLITKSGITKILDRLEARGLVKRVPSRDDRRSISIQLSAKDVEFWREFFPEVARSASRVFRRFPGCGGSRESCAKSAWLVERTGFEPSRPVDSAVVDLQSLWQELAAFFNSRRVIRSRRHAFRW
jgi:DNA-binding MarR family transcriptional regulator